LGDALPPAQFGSEVAMLPALLVLEREICRCKGPADRISSIRRLHEIQIVHVPAILYDGVGWKIL